jgi:Ca-activated chloride channel family protein
MDLRFQHLESLHWLWAVLAAGILLVVALVRKRHLLARLADDALLGRLVPAAGAARPAVRIVLLLAAMTMLVASLVDPRWGFTYRQVQQRGADVVVVLDVSRSMLAEDARPDRLERARQFIRDLVEDLGGDRVALVTFAGTATVRCPLTVDYGAFLTTLDTVVIEEGGRGGSLVGDALRTAVDAFLDEEPDHKAIIVFTDGEDHGSYPVEAAQRIADTRSIPVYTIGIGDSTEGGRIPVERDGQRFYLTHEGREVWSVMNAEQLRAVALATGGAFVPVGTATMDMAQVYKERIEPAAKREFEATEVKRYQARFQWFAGLALALLLIESFMGDRAARRAAERT